LGAAQIHTVETPTHPPMQQRFLCTPEHLKIQLPRRLMGGGEWGSYRKVSEKKRVGDGTLAQVLGGIRLSSVQQLCSGSLVYQEDGRFEENCPCRNLNRSFARSALRSMRSWLRNKPSYLNLSCVVETAGSIRSTMAASREGATESWGRFQVSWYSGGAGQGQHVGWFGDDEFVVSSRCQSDGAVCTDAVIHRMEASSVLLFFCSFSLHLAVDRRQIRFPVHAISIFPLQLSRS
jgi:hypothetical protein